ncbi:class I SAM-dependent methyltransferase [Aliidiomarina sanyensis]|uniref:Methyltransferase n=1 Tax=Aliidiomarina sanyensis TaxID=1249555 RepID=A0A432WKC7_9GAMM|nr:class I SAM-dependent methyltransferase [Aliidiomarina sanyensis]RUO34147.1 methyltransferase [Aliidiomarina sanyensis]
MKHIAPMTVAGLIALTFGTTAEAHNHGGNQALKEAIAAEHRTPAFVDRDHYRNPYETLNFFDVQPDMTVVEIWPGAGWYTEILAPYLHESGTLYAAHFPADHEREMYRNSRARFEEKMASHDVYENVIVTSFAPGVAHDIAPEGSADRVITFRNLHNWFMQGQEQGITDAFDAFYAALKPGGILGIVDHRLPEDRDDDAMHASGYMKASWARAFAEAAGFEYVGSSEVNANPNDTADHEGGVWALPPTLRHGDNDRERYQSIGESDRFTLKFRKPEA